MMPHKMLDKSKIWDLYTNGKDGTILSRGVKYRAGEVGWGVPSQGDVHI